MTRQRQCKTGVTYLRSAGSVPGPKTLPGLPPSAPTKRFKPDSENSWLYQIRSPLDCENAFVHHMVAHLVKCGRIEQDEKAFAESVARKSYRRRMNEKSQANGARGYGFPHNLRRLFSLSKKRQQRKLCREICITSDELAGAITSARQEGWVYKSEAMPHVPTDSRLPYGCVGLMRTNSNDQQAPKKLVAAFDGRKKVVWHLFQNGQTWHLLWFSNRDVGGDFEGISHWEQGYHLHYTSNAFGVSLESTLAAFSQRTQSVPSFHIPVDGFASGPG